MYSGNQNLICCIWWLQNKHVGPVAAPSNNYPAHGGSGAQSYASFALQVGSQHPEKGAGGSVSPPQYYYQNQQLSSAPTSSVYSAKPAYQFTQPIVPASAQTYYNGGASYPTASYSQPQPQYSHGPFSNYALQSHQPAASTTVAKYAYSPSAIYQSQISQYQPQHYHHQQPQKFNFYQW
jgi:hypothetical protein